MEKKEKQSISKECKSYLDKLEASPAWKPEMVKLAREDFSYGLSLEQVQQYMKKDWEYQRMKVYSDCLRKGYEEEIISVLTDDSLDGYQCAVAAEYYGQGVSIDCVLEVICNTRSAFEMRAAFQAFLKHRDALQKEADELPSYAKALVSQINEAVSQIRYHEEYFSEIQKVKELLEMGKQEHAQSEELSRSLQEKEEEVHLLQKQLEAQQDELNKGHKTVARLRTQIEELEEEKQNLEKRNSDLEIQVKHMKEKEAYQKMESVQPKPQETVSREAVSEMTVPYRIPVGNTGKETAVISVKQNRSRSLSKVGLLYQMGIIRKTQPDLYKRVISAELTPEQLIQIRTGFERGLTEKQLLQLIERNASAEKMKEIIALAVLINDNHREAEQV